MYIQTDDKSNFLRYLGEGNIEFDSNTFQPANSLSEEQAIHFGVHKLVEVKQPDYNPLYQRIKESIPAIQEGKWTQQWQVEDLSITEVQDNLQKQALDIKRRIVQETQNRLDIFANSRNYDGILSACTYATSNIPKFAAEGQIAVNLRDATWAALYQILEEVQAGQREAPTGFSDIEPLLPPLEWPV